MIARATTTVSILAGTETDPVFGDTADSFTPVATGVLASVIESSKTAREPSSSNPRIIRTHVARVGAGTVVDEENLLLDERTQDTYIVVNVTRNANPQSAQDLRLDLKRTGAAG